MPKKFGMTPAKYKDLIIKLLSKYRFMSASEISFKLRMGYETAKKYLMELDRERFITYRQIGNRKYWFRIK